jgi:hypothetical protein
VAEKISGDIVPARLSVEIRQPRVVASSARPFHTRSDQMKKVASRVEGKVQM